MARALVEVDGARQLRRTMRRAGEDFQDMKDLHTTVANIAAASVKTKAPKNTGALAGTVRGSGTKTAATVRAGFARTRYAGVNNYGWPAGSTMRGTFGGSSFMNDGAKAAEPRAIAVYEVGIDRIINRIQGA